MLSNSSARQSETKANAQSPRSMKTGCMIVGAVAPKLRVRFERDKQELNRVSQSSEGVRSFQLVPEDAGERTEADLFVR